MKKVAAFYSETGGTLADNMTHFIAEREDIKILDVSYVYDPVRKVIRSFILYDM